MATWMIRRKDGQSVLTYRNAERTQDCGSIPVVAERDLLAWVGDQAQAGDIILTPAGAFVRQDQVTRGATASA